MKKIFIAATVALCFTGSAIAQEKASGTSAFSSTFGAVTATSLTGAAVASLVVLGMNSNSRASIVDVVLDPTCSGSDPLANGVCTGTTTTVTVTGSGTMTSTTTVPVTFTYLPTL